MSTPEQRQVDRMIDRRFHFKSRDAVDGESNTMLDAIEPDVTGYATGPVHGPTAAPGITTSHRFSSN